MRKPLLVGLLVALLMPVLARAQSDFDGRWRIDLQQIGHVHETQRFPSAQQYLSV